MKWITIKSENDNPKTEKSETFTGIIEQRGNGKISQKPAYVYWNGVNWNTEEGWKVIEWLDESEEGNDAIEKEITRLQEKYDENGYNYPPLIKLQRMEQYIDMAFEIWAKEYKKLSESQPKEEVNEDEHKMEDWEKKWLRFQ